MQNLCGLEWATGALEGKWIEFGLTKTLQFDKYINLKQGCMGVTFNCVIYI